jgi:hypothetical protein
MTTTQARERRGLLLRIAAVVAAAAVVTPLAVALSHPLVQGWDETVGFGAGVVAACLAIRGLLGSLDRAGPSDRARPPADDVRAAVEPSPGGSPG